MWSTWTPTCRTNILGLDQLRFRRRYDYFASELGAAYEDAWTEWADGDDRALWDAAAADGLA